MFEYTPPPTAYEYTMDVSQIERPIRSIAKDHLASYSSEELDRNWRLHEFFDNI